MQIESWVNVAWFAIFSRNKCYTFLCNLRRKLNVHDISRSINNFYISRLEFLYRPNVPWRSMLMFRLANCRFLSLPYCVSVFRSDAWQSLWPLTISLLLLLMIEKHQTMFRWSNHILTSAAQPAITVFLLTPPPRQHCKSITNASVCVHVVTL